MAAEEVIDWTSGAACGCRMDRLITPGPGTVFKMQSCALGEACPTFKRMREYMEAQSHRPAIMVNKNGHRPT